MPAKLKTPIKVPTDPVPDYDEVLITDIHTTVNYEEINDFDGANLVKDVDGNYIKVETYTVKYLLISAGIIVDRRETLLEGIPLIDAMGRNPTARDTFKNSAFDILKAMNIVPPDATIA